MFSVHLTRCLRTLALRVRLGCSRWPRAARAMRALVRAKAILGNLKKDMFAYSCQTSKTRVRARLDFRTERLALVKPVRPACARLEIRTGRLASRQGARSASKMQSCWLDKPRSHVCSVPTGCAQRESSEMQPCWPDKPIENLKN